MSTYSVVNPATGETVAEYPLISDAALAEAVGRADSTHREWSRRSTVDDRAARIQRVADLHVERRQHLAEIAVREMGKPMEQALAEVDFSAEIYSYYAETAADIMRDEAVVLRGGEGSALVRRSSIGVLLGIMPWNFPLYQVARFAAPNLVIGNTVLLKHAPLSGGGVHEHLRLQRADRDGDRRPACAGCVTHGFGACGRGRGGDRGAQSQEGRARTGRV
jgi:succinate-semialdehyde dehydrogenase/glutarate-semialdehyde dehydrogenase